MREVGGRVVPHAEPLHQPARALVAGGRVGDDLLQAECREAEIERCSGGLVRDPLAPVCARQAPARLDGRRERYVIRDRGEPDEAGQLAARLQLDRPQPVAVALEGGLQALDRKRGLRPRERLREVLHHLRVGVERRERIEILTPPAAQQQPLGAQLRTGRDQRLVVSNFAVSGSRVSPGA